MTSTRPDGNQSSRLSRQSLAPTTQTQAGHQSSSTGTSKDKQAEALEAILEHELLEKARLQEKQRKWASWVNDQFVKCKNARQPFERQWYLNLAFVNGRHYVAPIEVPGQGFRLTSPRVPPWRVRLVVNKTRTAVRKECSKLSASRPIPTVIPATNEDEDFQAAQVAEELVQTQFGNADFERTYRSWIWWGVVCGTSFLKSYWSPNEPDPNYNEPQRPMMGLDGQPLSDPITGKPIMAPAKPLKGRIMTERITPFHIYVPDLLCEDLNKQPYIIHATTRSPLWVQRTFGFKPTCDVRASSTIMESAFIINKNGEEILDSVLVKEVWLKKDAHPDFPEGGLLTIINDRVVQWQDQWPWPFPEYPFYKYDGIPTGGFYSDSIVVDLIPLNKEYNRTKSQMIEIKNTMGKPKLLYAKGSINPRQISSEPGQGIPYVPGFPTPVVMQPAEVPATMGIELDRLAADFDDLSGQHEISRGQNPTQVTSGTAISFLQEQDDLTLTYQIASIEYAMELLGKHYLKYVSTYWDDARLIKVTGKDSNFEAKHWKGSDLRGNTDVKIQTGSALPTSKAARTAQITEMMQYGWLDPVTGLELMNMGGFNKALDQMLIDKKQAQRENMKMAALEPEDVIPFTQPPEQPIDPETGQPVGYWFDPMGNPSPVPFDENGQPWQPRPPIPVNSWDAHDQHIQFHNQYRKTQEFELLPEEVKEAFELHVQMHQMSMMSPQQGALGMVQPMDPEQEQQMLAQEQAGAEQEMQGQQFAQEQEAQQVNTSLEQALKLSQIDQSQAQVAMTNAQIQALGNKPAQSGPTG